MNINKVILFGRVGSIGAVKYFDDGVPVIEVRLATSETWKREGAERSTKTEWHTVQFRAKLAETISAYLEVGQELYVEGKARSRSYDKEGVTLHFHYVDALGFEFGDRPKPQQPDADGRPARSPERSSQAPGAAGAARDQQSRTYRSAPEQGPSRSSSRGYDASRPEPSGHEDDRPVRSGRVPRYAR